MAVLHIGIAACVVSLLLGLVADAQERGVKIGAMDHLTGGQRAFDMPSAAGARLAVAQGNADGSVLGRPVRLHLVSTTEREVKVSECEVKVIAAETTASFNAVPDAAAAAVRYNDTSSYAPGARLFSDEVQRAGRRGAGGRAAAP